MPNRLINETSPYLLQHANNPVDWHAWGADALQRAKDENKPILVSIGYSACHWCHVMERESFEDEETATLMNSDFINIKVDREERPDLDHIYMDAVQAMTGSGGWPLNVFLTPDAKPFYGGTYFPPKRAFNRSSWKEVLAAVSNAFQQKRGEVDSQAEQLTRHLQQSNFFGQVDSSGSLSKDMLKEAFQNLMKTADTEWGGFGRAPKFPQTFSIQFLLRYHYQTGNEEALRQARLSLDKMIQGGIYDQLGGGFARYSTDYKWLVPHFEKMLYDNALLVSVLADAYQLTKQESYKRVITETMAFVTRDLIRPDRGFYSALDADSEGEEGKYYVWDFAEAEKLLGEDFEITAKFFDITPAGNWEGKTVLHTSVAPEHLAQRENISLAVCYAILERSMSILFTERKKRILPSIDDKIILSWNALMNTACSKAFAATGRHEYRDLAISNMQFLLSRFKNKGEKFFHHNWKERQGTAAFLDDYASLIEAMLYLQEITGRTEWLMEARQIAEYVIENFSDEQSRFFYFTDRNQADVLVRKKEVYDGATPSGNATMAYNIYRLSILFDIPEWRKRSEEMVSSLQNAVMRYPGSFGLWANLCAEIVNGTNEIAVVGKDAQRLGEQLLAEFIPHKVLMISPMGDEKFPLLSGKSENPISLIYLCQAYSCLKPVSQVHELLNLINIRNKNY